MMQLFLVQGNELVFARAKAYLRGMLEDMNSMNSQMKIKKPYEETGTMFLT